MLILLPDARKCGEPEPEAWNLTNEPCSKNILQFTLWGQSTLSTHDMGTDAI